jgi:NADPH-dependent curcumin reductase CurA
MKPPYYRALQLARHAGSLREATDIVALPWVEPGPGEIAVRNTWCGVNAIFDTQIARNAVDYVQVKVPAVMGVEAIGTVQAVGPGVSEFTRGDAVVTVRFGGGYRECNIGAASNFVAVPSVAREWLALASTGVSAMLALDHVGQAKPGETVAISAAAGGLGHFLVQLAKLRGCKVVAICGGSAKTEFVRGLGADRVIDYRNESVTDVLRSEFRDAIDVAIDTVSGDIFDALLDNLAPHGRLVAGGAAQDLSGRPEITTGPRVVHKLYYKAASVRGFMNGMLTPLWPEARRRLFEEFGAGRVKVVFDETHFEGIQGICDAAEHLLSGRSMGKVVVQFPAEPDSPSVP